MAGLSRYQHELNEQYSQLYGRYEQGVRNYAILLEFYQALTQKLGEGVTQEDLEMRRTHEKTRSWWEWWTGAPSEDGGSTKPTSEERAAGCQDLSCCFDLWWASVGELFHHTMNLSYQFVWDPYSVGGHWITRLFQAGFWGPVAGFSLAFLLINLLIYAVMRAADVWGGVRRLTGGLAHLPMIAVWGQLFSRLRSSAPSAKATVQEALRDIQQMKKRMIANERKREEEEALRVARKVQEELRNLTEGPSGQEGALRKSIEELQNSFQLLAADFGRLAGQRGQGEARAFPPGVAEGSPQGPFVSTPRRRNPKDAPRVVRKCQTCGGLHTGPCWQITKCEECGRFGRCPHRQLIINRSQERRAREAARSRQTSPARSVALCLEQDDADILSEMQNQWGEGSSENSTISLNPGVKNTPDDEPREVAVLTSKERAFGDGHFVHKGNLWGRRFLLDTGATVNLLSEAACKQLGLYLRETGTKVCALAGKSLEVKGRVTVLTRLYGREKELDYLVVKGNEDDIIGYSSMKAFGIDLRVPEGEQLSLEEQKN